MGMCFSFGAVTFLVGSYTFDYESDSRGVVLGYLTAITFTAGSAAFLVSCFLVFKLYFGDHPPRVIPILS